MRAERDELRRRDEVHRQQEERLAERMEDYHAMVKEREVGLSWSLRKLCANDLVDGGPLHPADTTLAGISSCRRLPR